MLTTAERSALLDAIWDMPLGTASVELLSAVAKLKADPSPSRRSPRVSRNGARHDPAEVERNTVAILDVLSDETEGLTEARIARMTHNADHRNANFQRSIELLLETDQIRQTGTWRQSPVYVRIDAGADNGRSQTWEAGEGGLEQEGATT